MVFASNGDQSAIEHNEHDFLQSIIFFLILLLSGVAFYLAILPITEMLIQNFLSGVVRNSGESVADSLQQQLPVEKTSIIRRATNDTIFSGDRPNRGAITPGYRAGIHERSVIPLKV